MKLENKSWQFKYLKANKLLKICTPFLTFVFLEINK